MGHIEFETFPCVPSDDARENPHNWLILLFIYFRLHGDIGVSIWVRFIIEASDINRFILPPHQTSGSSFAILGDYERAPWHHHSR